MRHDANAGTIAQPLRVGFNEGQRYAINEVRHAKAVWPFDDHAGLVGDSANLSLLRQTFLTAFGKSGGKDDGGADIACGQRLHRIEHRSARDGEDGGINAIGQGIDRGQAWPSADFGALGIDEVDVAGKAVADQVGQDGCAQRTRLVRCADDRHRSRAEQPIERIAGAGGGDGRIEGVGRHGSVSPKNCLGGPTFRSVPPICRCSGLLFRLVVRA